MLNYVSKSAPSPLLGANPLPASMPCELNHYNETPGELGNKNFNTSRPTQNGRRFADDTFKRIFLNENIII